MNAVERIDFYTHNIPAEPDTVEPPVAVPAEWPATGRVEFRDYSMRYREGLPLVLKKTSFAVGAGEKVGSPGGLARVLVSPLAPRACAGAYSQGA